jgi:hypothetical protein
MALPDRIPERFTPIDVNETPHEADVVSLHRISPELARAWRESADFLRILAEQDKWLLDGPTTDTEDW